MEAAELLGLVVMGEWLFIRSDQVAAIVWSKEMGERLHQLRKQAKLSLRKLEKLAKDEGRSVSYQYITLLEKGEAGTVDVEIVTTLCSVLNAQPTDFLYCTTVTSPEPVDLDKS